MGKSLLIIRSMETKLNKFAVIAYYLLFVGSIIMGTIIFSHF